MVPAPRLLLLALTLATTACQATEGPGSHEPPTGITSVTSRSVVWWNIDRQGATWKQLGLAPLQTALPPSFAVTTDSAQQHAKAYHMAFRLGLGDAYPLVAVPGEDTLLLSVRVVDRTAIPYLLERAGSGPLAADGRVRGVALEIVARDGVTGELVATAINQFEAPALASSLAHPGSEEDMVRVFLPFALRVRRALDQSNLRMLN